MKPKLVRNVAIKASNPSDGVRPWDETNPRNWFSDPYLKRIDELDSRLKRIEALLGAELGVAVESDKGWSEQAKARTKRGPTEAIPLEHLLIRRDTLVQFLEFHWPLLGRLFAQPQNGTAILLALRKCVNSPNSSLVPTARDLLKRSTALFRFLRSSEYKGDPRQVANAMAGVPEYSWSTSLKKCRAHPSKLAVGEAALRDYVRRKCPGIFSRLLNAETPEQVERIMKSLHTRDRELSWLASHPQYLLKVLERGRPRKFL
jgi:hypothetical protein